MNENLPQVIQEGFFTKIKKWFLKFFRKQKSIESQIQALDDVQNDINEINKENFMQNIKVENKDNIIILQRKIKEKQIEIADLTNQELDEIITLYKEQIEEKKVKLRQYRIKIKNIEVNES